MALVLQLLPQTLIGPAAGVVNDRLRRKHVMIAADPGSSIIPNIVEREDVVVANTLSSATWSINLMLGATTGGVIAALPGRDAAFVLNAISFLVSALLVLSMRFAEPHAAGAHALHSRDLVNFSPVAAGIRYVRSHAGLRSTLFVKASNLIIGPSWVLFTVMGQKEFAVRWYGLGLQRGAFLGMSLLLGARGLGALLGPLLSAPWAGHWIRRLETAIFWGYLATAVGYGLLGTARYLWQACLFVMVAHFGSSMVWVFSTTLLQLQTEDRFRGRVFAADLGLSMLTIAAGAYIAGRHVDWGFVALYVASAAGVLMLIPAIWWGLTVRGTS